MKNVLRSKFLLVLALSLLLLTALSGCGSSYEGTVSDDVPTDDVIPSEVDWDFYTERAKSFILEMAGGNFDEAEDMLDPEVIEVLDDLGIELQDIWEANLAQAGVFLSVYETEHFAEDGLYFILLTSQHENSGILEQFAFTEDGLIAGWQTLGFPRLEVTEPTESTSFTDSIIIIGEETEFPLDAMLSMPDDVTGQIPAAIIVGGSGSHNMDGIAPPLAINPIYRSIAHYLAENGIAVIRHDRRLHTHAERGAEIFGESLTVREEVIEDALLAVEILRADPRIDSDRIYIIGHSLGGMLAPRIHAEADFAGLILMAATPRNLLEVAIGQFRESAYTAIAIEMLTEEDLADLITQIEEADELFDILLDLSDEEARETPDPLFGLMSYYFKDMAMHPFADYVQELTVPILVMQPSRDFQIRADVDFVLLQELFAGRDNVTFRLYEDLNHAFIPTTAENFIEHATSIATPGHMYIPALQDIVNWILGQ